MLTGEKLLSVGKRLISAEEQYTPHHRHNSVRCGRGRTVMLVVAVHTPLLKVA